MSTSLHKKSLMVAGTYARVKADGRIGFVTAAQYGFCQLHLTDGKLEAFEFDKLEICDHPQHAAHEELSTIHAELSKTLPHSPTDDQVHAEVARRRKLVAQAELDRKELARSASVPGGRSLIPSVTQTKE